MRKLLWLLVPAAALLVGCFNLENSYVINEDGSGTQSVRFSIPIEVLEGLGGELPSVEDADSDPDIQALREALGDQGSITFFSNEEEGFGMEAVLHAPASDNFSAAIKEVIAGLPEDSGVDFEELLGTTESIQRDGDTWTFERELAPLTSDDIAGLTGDPESAGIASLFLGESSVTVRLLLPGKVTEHNADEVLEDGTLVWTQSGVDPVRTLTATSELGGGSNLRLILIVAAVLAAAAVIAMAAYFATRGGSDDAEPESEVERGA